MNEIQSDSKNNRKNGGEDTRNNTGKHKRHIVQHTINARECCPLSDLSYAVSEDLLEIRGNLK